MSELVGVFATSHTPVMINLADNAPERVRNEVFTVFRDLGRRITEAQADVLVVISDDHLHNFFLDNFPSFCIGAAAQYPGPIEQWLRTEQATVRGDPELGAHLLFEVMERGFDPSFTMQFTLDHGYVVPLELAGIRGNHRIVPVHVNTVQPPMPSPRRCLAFGRVSAKRFAHGRQKQMWQCWRQVASAMTSAPHAWGCSTNNSTASSCASLNPVTPSPSLNSRRPTSTKPETEPRKFAAG